MKLYDALKELTYPTIASKVILSLYTQGETRSSALVNQIAKEIDCSKALVYTTLKELQGRELIYLPIDRKRFKMYALTDSGRKMVEDEVKKTEVEIEEIRRRLDQPTTTMIEVLTEDFFKDLPNRLQTPSNRMLVRQELLRSIKETKAKIARRLEAEG